MIISAIVSVVSFILFDIYGCSSIIISKAYSIIHTSLYRGTQDFKDIFN